MPAHSTFNSEVILQRLGPDRLTSYLNDSDNDLERALDLYAWNSQIAAAFLEDLGRLEVPFCDCLTDAPTMPRLPFVPLLPRTCKQMLLFANTVAIVHYSIHDLCFSFSPKR